MRNCDVLSSLTLDAKIKFLTKDGGAPIGKGKWHLPTLNDAQEWQPSEHMNMYKSNPVMCQRGYHYTTIRNCFEYMADRMFLIEPIGKIIEGETKSVSQGAYLVAEVQTWNARNQRLFAADCAERVVHLCGDDPRPKDAIKAARDFANGLIGVEELGAARDAARAAARGATRDAARAAARGATSDAAWDAARDAARDAAWDAARAATSDAAWDAEVSWQKNRLLQYLKGEV